MRAWRGMVVLVVWYLATKDGPRAGSDHRVHTGSSNHRQSPSLPACQLGHDDEAADEVTLPYPLPIRRKVRGYLA